MKAAAAFRKSAAWWLVAAIVGGPWIINAIAGNNDGTTSRYVNLPPADATVVVGDAIAEAPGNRDIPPLALAEPPATFQFVFSPSLDTASQVEIRSEVGLAARYFEATGAGTLGPITIHVATTPESLSTMYQSETHAYDGPGDPSYWDAHGGVYSHGSVYLLFSPSGGDDSDSTYYSARAAVRPMSQASVTHELAHALDDSLAAPGFDASVPRWLVEGSAEVEAYTSLDAFGFRTFEGERRQRMSDARGIATTLSTTNNTEVNDVYTLGFLAVDRLTQGGSLQPLRQFWSELGKGVDWETSFKHAFGATPADFEASFEDYRAENFPRYRGEIRGTVQGVDAATYVRVWACGALNGECTYGRTNASGEFALVLPDDRYTVEFQVHVPDGPEIASDGWFFAIRGLTQDSGEAAVISVHDSTVTGLDVSLADLQAKNAARLTQPTPGTR